MMNLDEKIRKFKDEVGDPSKLNSEQRKIYAAFVSRNAKKEVAVIDKYGEKLNIRIDPTKLNDGPKHILEEHYKESEGKVTAKEILNMCNVIRNGDKSQRGQIRSYRIKKQINHIKFTICIKISENGKFLKTFYSNRGMARKQKRG